MPTGRRRYAMLVLALAVIGCAAHWPALRSGLVADDYLQRSMLEGSYPVQRSPLDLFSFVDASRGDLGPTMDAGTFPWWVHPQLKLTALRPLSSLLVVLDVTLGLSPFAAHVHSLLWWLALLVVLAAFLRQRVPAAVALLATAIYAFDPSSVTPVGWLSNRNAIVSALFGLVALWAHISWRERDWHPGPFVAGAAFALSLLGGEYAFGMFGYLIAYELVAGSGGARRRLRALFPVAAPLAAYFALHVALGYGARGSSMYVDPLRQPLVFAADALLRFPALVVGELLNIPGELTHAALALHLTGLVLLLIPVLAAIATVAPGAIRRLEPGPRRMVLFLLLGAALSLLPVLGAPPSARLLLVPALGGSVFIGVLIRDAALRFLEAGALKRPFVWLGGLVGLGLFTAHVLLAPLTTYVQSSGWSSTQRLARSLYRRAKLDDRKLPGQTVVLLNSFELLTLIYPPYVRHQHGSPLPHAWRALSTTWEPLALRRTALDSIELDAKHGSLLQAVTVTLLRSEDLPVRVGERFHVRGMDVEVLAMDGWGPKSVRYHFDDDLDAPRFVFLEMGANGLRRLRLPRPGHSLEVPGIPKAILDAFKSP